MRVACIILDSPAHRWFVNRLAAVHHVETVFVETGPSTIERLRRRPGPRTAARVAGTQWRVRRQARDPTGARDRLLGDGWQRLDGGLERVEVRAAADAGVRERLEAARPDVLFTFGCGILPPATIAAAGHAFNLHWGLAPWYRGVLCVQWALLRWDPYNIGSTLHEITPAVDGGPIVGQARPALDPHDNLLTIRLKLTTLGADMAVEVCDTLAAGRSPLLREQDLSLGTLYRTEQWGAGLTRQVEWLERNGGLARMLDHPSAPPRAGVKGVEPAPA